MLLAMPDTNTHGTGSNQRFAGHSHNDQDVRRRGIKDGEKRQTAHLYNVFTLAKAASNVAGYAHRSKRSDMGVPELEGTLDTGDKQPPMPSKTQWATPEGRPLHWEGA